MAGVRNHPPINKIKNPKSMIFIPPPVLPQNNVKIPQIIIKNPIVTRIVPTVLNMPEILLPV